MSWRWFGGVGPAINGLDSHAPHQGSDMPATNHPALLPEQIAQHTATRKGITQMELVDAPHRCSASATDRRLAPDDRDSRRCCG